jgi:penicillin-binding protein 1A
MITLFRKILLFSLVSIIAIFVFVISILWNYSNKLPDYKILKNYKPPVSSKLYSGAGELVSEFSSEKRIFVPYNSIPRTVIYAFLSAEDKNFFSHPGVDAKGIARAVLNNISNVII